MDRQSKVVMQATGIVLLHNKDAPAAALPYSTYRLGGYREPSLSAIVREQHARPHLLPPALDLCAKAFSAR